MSWIDDYSLYLFDFDGLLVNTEELHFLAYKKMMAQHGINLTWSFTRYCQAAHYSSDLLRKELFKEYPLLASVDPTWEKLYQEKQSILQTLFKEGAVHLMPGVSALLHHLQKRQAKQCVVTHSPDQLVNLVRLQHPILDQIPYWITRHDYTHPKPHPECYQLAIHRYQSPGERTVGFEDTPRGLTALLGTSADPILISQVPYPELPGFIEKGVKHFLTFERMVSLDSRFSTTLKKPKIV